MLYLINQFYKINVSIKKSALWPMSFPLLKNPPEADFSQMLNVNG